MTQEDKELLLKDLCARVYYGVLFMVYDDKINEPVELLSINPKRDKPLEIDDGYDENSSTYWSLEDVKPYLRPLSSMTEEEKLHVELTYGFFYHDGVLDNIHIFEVGGTYDRDGNYAPPCEYRQERHVTIEQVLDFIYWLNKNMFDYHGLIEKNLALDCTELHIYD